MTDTRNAHGGRRWLKGSVRCEPLVNGWHATPLLVAPATAAMFLHQGHLEIMRSYIRAPHVHDSAVKNPRLAGAPFIDYDARRVDDIRALERQVVAEQGPALTLARAIIDGEELLRRRADGLSLEPLYRELPEPLRGHVELVYDRGGHASLRLLERLLYRSDYYRPTAQTWMLAEQDDHVRPSVWSPRPPGGGGVRLRIPFSDPRLDDLFRARREAVDPARLRDRLELGGADEAAFAALFTVEPPVERPARRYTGPGLRIRYLGHACLLIETREVAILIDAMVSYEAPAAPERFTLADLPDRIDYAVVTHSHPDHLSLETLLQLRHRIATVVVPRSSAGVLEDPSPRILLETLRFPRVVELEPYEELAVPGGAIVGLPFLGEHGDLAIEAKLTYLFRLAGRAIVCAADAKNIDPVIYQRARAVLAAIDALFIGIECKGAPTSWAYGPLHTQPLTRRSDQSRLMSGSEASEALDMALGLGASKVFVYGLGLEPWLQHIVCHPGDVEPPSVAEAARLLEACAARGIAGRRLAGADEVVL